MGVLKGGYVALKETAPLELILLASGSELQWALDVAKETKGVVRVVSMPCFSRFDRQDDDYKAEVLPRSVTKRVAIEAGVTGLWYKYVGLDGKVIGTDDFGFSAPGGTVMDAFGINVGNLLAVVETMLSEETNRKPSTVIATQSANWSRIECRTNDSLPSVDLKSVRSLDSLPECPDEDSPNTSEAEGEMCSDSEA